MRTHISITCGIAIAILLTLMALTAAGCGGQSQTQKMHDQLQKLAQSQKAVRKAACQVQTDPSGSC